MRRVLLLGLLIPLGLTRPALAVTVAGVSLLRLDESTVRLYVSNVGVFTNENLYELFNVPTVSPYGDHVYLGAYGNPTSMIQGGFGIPTGLGGNVQVLGPGETLGSGLDYSIDLLSPPWDGYVGLNFHVVQDYFYEYALPDGSVFRDLAGELDGDLHFAGNVPAISGTWGELLITPEPRTLELLATAVVLLCLFGRPRGRRSTP